MLSDTTTLGNSEKKTQIVEPHVHAYVRLHLGAFSYKQLWYPLHPHQFSYLFTQFEQVGAKYCDSAPQAFYLFVYLSTFISPVPGRGLGG